MPTKNPETLAGTSLFNQVADAPNEGALRTLINSADFLRAVAALKDTRPEEVDRLRAVVRDTLYDLRNGVSLPWRNLRDIRNRRITIVNVSRPLPSTTTAYGSTEPMAVHKIVMRAREGVEEFKLSVTSNQRVYRDVVGYRLADMVAQKGEVDVIFRKGEEQQSPWSLDIPSMRPAQSEEEVPF